MMSEVSTGQWRAILDLEGHEPCPGVEIESDVAIQETDAGRQWATVYRPARAPARPMPVVVGFHGGGFALGNPNGVGMVAKYLAVALGMTTVSSSYRLGAPDRPTFPGPVADALDAMRWVRANAGRLGVDGGRVILEGNSAGACVATLTAVVADYSLAGELGRLGSLGGELPARVGLLVCWGEEKGSHCFVSPVARFGGLWAWLGGW